MAHLKSTHCIKGDGHEFLLPPSTARRKKTADSRSSWESSTRTGWKGHGDGSSCASPITGKAGFFQPTQSKLVTVEECSLNELRELQTKIQLATSKRNKLFLSNKFQEGLDASREVTKLASRCMKLANLSEEVLQNTVYPLIFRCSLSHADCHVMAGKFKQAEKLYLSLIRQDCISDKYQRTIVFRLAEFYQRQERYENAIQMWLSLYDETDIADGPERSNVISKIAKCYAALGRLDLAYKYNEINAEMGLDHPVLFYRFLYLAKRREDLDVLRESFLSLLVVKNCPYCHPADGPAPTESEDCYFASDSACSSHIRDAAILLFEYTSDRNNVERSDLKEWCVGHLRESDWNDVIVDIHLDQCGKLLDSGNLSEAVDLLTDGEYDDLPDLSQSRIYTFLSWIHFYCGNVQQCLENAENAEKLDKNSTDANRNIGCAKFLRGDLMEALKTFEKLSAKNAMDYRSTLFKGLTQKELKMYNDAIWTLASLPDKHVNSGIKAELAELYELAGRYEDAYDTFLTLRGLPGREKDVKITLRLGSLADTLQDQDTAVWFYNQVLQLNSENLTALDALGRFSVTKNVPEKAVELYQTAFKAEPENPKWQVLLAAATRRTGRILEAYDLCLKTHQSFSDDISCLQLLINISKQLRIPEDQIQILRGKLDDLTLPKISSTALSRLSTGLPRCATAARLSVRTSSMTSNSRTNSKLTDYAGSESALLTRPSSQMSSRFSFNISKSSRASTAMPLGSPELRKSRQSCHSYSPVPSVDLWKNDMNPVTESAGLVDDQLLPAFF